MSETEKGTGPRPAQVTRIDPGTQMLMMGPMMVDQAIRQAIQHCWLILPPDQRTPDRVEQEIRRLVDRALRDWHEDASAFGIQSRLDRKQEDRES